jgi:outer membrane protein TolC
LEAEAISGIAVVQSGRRSQLSANGTVGALREGSPTSETTVGASGDVMLSQLVYDGGAIGGAVDAATAVAIAAQADRLAQGNTIALEAARAWVHYWQADRRLGYLDEATADLADVIEQVDRMAASGMLDQAAVENVRKQHLGIQLERGALEAARSEAALRFALYFGEAPQSLPQPVPLLTPQIARARAAEWQSAPALKRIAAEVFAAKGAEQEALAAFKPVIRMQGGVNTPMDANDTTDVSAGLRIQYVFNDGGRRKAQLAAAKQRVFALEAQFTDAQRVAQTEMQASLVQLDALEEAMALVQEKSVLTQSEVEIARSQIATGQVNLQQLLTAEIENYRAVDQSIQLQGEKHVLLLTIAAQSGYLTKLIGLDG